MDSTEFQLLVERIRGGCISKTDADVELLHRLALTKELQDFEWTSSLYDAIWTALRDIWSKALTALTKEEITRLWKIERLLIQSFNLICKLPEFNTIAAADSLLLSSATVQLIFKRVLIICPSLSSIQHCLHWIYQNRLDLRITMRKCISSVLLTQSTSLVPGFQKSRHNDGGKGRDHVAPMLELLLCIIEGFLTPLKDADRGLLERVLMPLHQPNQMVEWRDQIPVLQLYHPQLVNCVKALIEKSEIYEECPSAATAAVTTAAAAATVTVTMDCYNSNEKSQYQPDNEYKLPLFRSSNSMGKVDGSLLVTAVKRLLSFWPQSYAANTPKELLMLHELEALVAMSCPPSINPKTNHNNNHKDSKINNNELSELMDLFLKKVVSSLGKGGDSDNFRTTQRTLQVFKNKKILKIISSLHVKQNGSDDSSEEKNMEKDKNSNIISSPLGQVFCILIPALYRDGKMSWNPTVNKMTVLVLRSLRAVNEQAFERCSKHVLCGNSSTVTNESDMVDTNKSSAAINTSDSIKEKQIYVSEGNMISSNTTSSYRSPPLPCDQSHKHSYSNKKMRSPVPNFDPTSNTSSSHGLRTDSVPAGFHVNNGSRIASMSGMKTITATGKSLSKRYNY